MKIDLAAKRASGWAFKEKHRSPSTSPRSRRLCAANASRSPQEHDPRNARGWCVETAALARWFGIGVKPMTSGSVLLLESEAKLPVELAIERQERAAQLKPAKFDLVEPAAGPPALSHVARAGARLRRQRRRHLPRQGRRQGRSPDLGLRRGRDRPLSYDAQLIDHSRRACRAACASAPIARTPKAGCSAR